METVYLDNAATMPMRKEALEAMMPFFGADYGNPASIHSMSRSPRKAVNEAREKIAKVLNAEPSEIYFTSGGTESDNWALVSGSALRPDKGKHIIISTIEHHAILETADYLAKQGYEVTKVGVDETGRIRLDELLKSIRPDTVLISVMTANNEIGTIQPIAEIGRIAREKGILFHTDAVQAAGKVPIDLASLPVDMLSLSGHKLHAPKGIGALYVRRGVRFRPFIRGGHQERGRRAGTENVPYIAGLGVACRLARESMQDETTRVAALRDRLEQGIVSRIPDCLVNGDTEHRLPGTTNIAFRNIEGESVLLMLDRLGICASSGSACTSGSLEPSHVLHAMGVPFKYAHSATRLSLSRYNTQEEVDYCVEHFPAVVETLRRLSPFKD